MRWALLPCRWERKIRGFRKTVRFRWWHRPRAQDWLLSHERLSSWSEIDSEFLYDFAEVDQGGMCRHPCSALYLGRLDQDVLILWRKSVMLEDLRWSMIYSPLLRGGVKLNQKTLNFCRYPLVARKITLIIGNLSLWSSRENRHSQVLIT